MAKYFNSMQIYLKQSIFSAFSILNLVNDLLDLAKMETDTFTIHKENFNLIEVVT